MPPFTYNCGLDNNNPVTLLVEAGPDADLTLAGSVAIAGQFQPPPYAQVRDLWNKRQLVVKSRAFLDEPLNLPGSALRRGQLVLSFSMNTPTPNPDQNHQYTAIFNINQSGASRLRATLSLPKWHLDQWHSCIINFV